MSRNSGPGKPSEDLWEIKPRYYLERLAQDQEREIERKRRIVAEMKAAQERRP